MGEFGIPIAEGNSSGANAEQDKATIAAICDRGSTLYNMAYAMGCAVAPIIGGALNDATNFRRTSDIMAFAACGLLVFYAIVGLLCHKEDRTNDGESDGGDSEEDELKQKLRSSEKF